MRRNRPFSSSRRTGGGGARASLNSLNYKPLVLQKNVSTNTSSPPSPKSSNENLTTTTMTTTTTTKTTTSSSSSSSFLSSSTAPLETNFEGVNFQRSRQNVTEDPVGNVENRESTTSLEFPVDNNENALLGNIVMGEKDQCEDLFGDDDFLNNSDVLSFVEKIEKQHEMQSKPNQEQQIDAKVNIVEDAEEVLHEVDKSFVDANHYAKPHVELNEEMAKVWIYPNNFPPRRYQLLISKNALFKNTLVCLPTGLGKTLIASVVMYNYYRWFPEGKIVFMAPKKPLVAQQIHACYDIMGFREQDMVEMTGTLASRKDRNKLWREKRVFFATPHIVRNDLADKTCPASEIVLLVFDEAHSAQGKYPYCDVIKLVEEAKKDYDFRVLALTATPATTLPQIQELINNLLISHIEVYDEDDEEVKPYTFDKIVDVMPVALSPEINSILKSLYSLMAFPLRRLCSSHALHTNDPSKLYYDMVRKAAFGATEARFGDRTWLIRSDFSALQKLTKIKQVLLNNGIRAAYESMKTTRDEVLSEKKKNAKLEVFSSPTFQDMMKRIDYYFQNGVISHPKFSALENIVLEHFKNVNKTRVIIFAHYRDCVQEITQLLSKHSPVIKVKEFVGQSNRKNGIGLKQKEQKQVLEKFRDGLFNCLVSTSVGEEGLDIPHVDLIICFDTFSSPIRMVQRMGRTGRKREGRAVLLVTQGVEEMALESAERKRITIIKRVKQDRHNNTLRLFANNNRMIPCHIYPELKQTNIEVLPLKSNFGQKKKGKSSASSARAVEIDRLEFDYVRQHYGIAKLDDKHSDFFRTSLKSQYFISGSPYELIGPSIKSLVVKNAVKLLHDSQYFDELFDLYQSPYIVEKDYCGNPSKMRSIFTHKKKSDTRDQDNLQVVDLNQQQYSSDGDETYKSPEIPHSEDLDDSVQLVECNDSLDHNTSELHQNSPDSDGYYNSTTIHSQFIFPEDELSNKKHQEEQNQHTNAEREENQQLDKEEVSKFDENENVAVQDKEESDPFCYDPLDSVDRQHEQEEPQDLSQILPKIPPFKYWKGASVSKYGISGVDYLFHIPKCQSNENAEKWWFIRKSAHKQTEVHSSSREDFGSDHPQQRVNAKPSNIDKRKIEFYQEYARSKKQRISSNLG